MDRFDQCHADYRASCQLVEQRFGKVGSWSEGEPEHIDNRMSQGTASPEARSSLAQLPSGIWALGFVSLFMDISSEMIHGLLPMFLTSVLGASTEMLGVIEGIGEATASISKLFSGWVSDKLGKRKALTLIGYGLGALSKPLPSRSPERTEHYQTV
jgi:sugar phosphate permease